MLKRIVIRAMFLCGWPAMLSAQMLSAPPAAPAGYPVADSIAAIYSGHPLDHPALLAQKLTSQLHTDTLKFRALYTWVCTNVKNDYHLYDKNRRKLIKYQDQPEKLAEWRRRFAPVVFRKLREDRATLCTGYAYILRELARYAGIKAQIINGYGRTATSRNEPNVNHSWIAVLLDGKWSLCDPTWSSGYLQDRHFIARYDDAYFLADPRLFLLNHYPEDPAWILLEDTPSREDFINGPVGYSSAYAYHILPHDTTRYIAVKDTPWTFSFQAPSGLEDSLTLSICKGSAGRMVTPRISYENQRYTLTHTFRTKGRYDVHLFVNGAIALTCTVQVLPRQASAAEAE